MSESAPAQRPAVVVAAEHALVSEVIVNGLRGCGFEAVAVSWPGEHVAPVGRTAGADRCVGLLINEVDGWPRLRAARVLMASFPAPWLALTEAPRGPMWGALLEAGARVVLPSSTGFEDVCTALVDVDAGMLTTPVGERRLLLGLWKELQQRRELIGRRVDSLTPREHEVLSMLHAGDPVVRIAQLLELSPSTVRSQMKAVRRKLGVNTQLGAVAALDDLLELEELEPLERLQPLA